ncbi:General negative regulator of transcription subunit 1 [Neolecta irregularis DAH-3]|uniref:General negative regulator of transcription subunit 1 n=1 Tax=Neolecta irregularis (strain DAH-3) TaxID=1198029 RepID=A0A1U7LK60_NEOID|nr:General negative regulator of transcription subunit 1 [Neolecta irregularis DAH-3]|eukprot:OLL23018.1 General negative regulator of transcription subunit 1 [Neolecta irregularis DAH-3]
MSAQPPDPGPVSPNSSSNRYITITKAQINFLLSTLSEQKYSAVVDQIHTLTESQTTIHAYFLRRLIYGNSKELFNIIPKDVELSQLGFRLLIEELRLVARKPSISACFRDAIQLGHEGEVFKNFDLHRLFSAVDLSPFETCTLALSVLRSTQQDLVEKGYSLLPDGALTCLATEVFKAHADGLISTFSTPAELVDLPAEELALFVQQLSSLSSSSFPESLQTLVLDAIPKRYEDGNMPEIVQQSASFSISLMKFLELLFKSLGSGTSEISPKIYGLFSNSIDDDVRPSEKTIVAILILLVKEAEQGNMAFNPEQIGVEIARLLPNLNWASVVLGFDRSDFIIYEPQGLAIILEIMRSALRHKDAFPILEFWGQWTHQRAQLSILRAFTKLPPEIFDLSKYPGRRIVSMEESSDAPAPVKAMISSLETGTFNSLDLVERIFLLTNPETLPEGDDFLSDVAYAAPDLVLLGGVQLAAPWVPHHEALISRLFLHFFHSQPINLMVFYKLFQTAPDFLFTRVRNILEQDRMQASRVLDIAQELRILEAILQIRPYELSLELSSLASRREYLNLEKYVRGEMKGPHKEEFVTAVLEFLRVKAMAETEQRERPHQEPTTIALQTETVAILLRPTLNKKRAFSFHSKADHFQEHSSSPTYPRLFNIEFDESGSIIRPVNASNSNLLPPDVEAEVDQDYKELYNNNNTNDTSAINRIILKLRGYKRSHDPADHDVLAHMLHGLFDEYRFFYQYPTPALAVTAVLFGSLVHFRLLPEIPQAIALRCVYKALQQPPESNMYKFGVQALHQFADRVHEFPQYMANILAIQSLQENYPEIIDKIEPSGDRIPFQRVASPPSLHQGGESQEPETPQQPPFQSIARDASDALPLPQEDLPEAAQDKVIFCINNTSVSNVDAKVKEIKNLLDDKYVRWAADHIFVDRARLEPNQHPLYLQVLETLNKKHLYTAILDATYATIIRLLNCPSTLTESTEKLALKNLGSWLGGLTLARNKPIKHRNLSIKDLLLEGFETDRLIVVIPFVTKILEQVTKSKVFKPPNPWTMAMIKTLVEFYQEAELKLMLKFDIELLCKALELELNDIIPTTLLQARPGIYGLNLPDGLDVAIHSQEVYLPPDYMTTFDIVSQIVLDSSALAYIPHSDILSVISKAVDRTIREVIVPIVEKSVTIASITTRELVIKDFAMEGSEERMRHAAHQMIEQLSGSLSDVTGKEALKINLGNNFKLLLSNDGVHEETVPENAVSRIINDNIDLICNVIRKVAQSKAVKDIDDALTSAYHRRRRHREAKTGKPFFDSAASQYAMSLPLPLRLASGGLTAVQLSLYDKFADMGNAAIAAKITNEQARLNASMEMANEVAAFGGPTTSAYEQRLPAATIEASIERLTNVVAEFQKFAKEIPDTGRSYFHLPLEHELPQQVQQIVQFAKDLVARTQRDDYMLTVCQQACTKLFKSSEIPLAREAYADLLTKFCEIAPRVGREVQIWLLDLSDERKLDAPVISTLVNTTLISLPDLDISLARAVQTRSRHFVLFAAELLQILVLGPRAIVTRIQFANTIEALEGVTEREDTHPLVSEVVGTFRSDNGENSLSQEQPDDDKDKLLHLFVTDWNKCVQRSVREHNDTPLLAFVYQLQQTKIITDVNMATMFLRNAFQYSLEFFVKQSFTAQSFVFIDNYAKMIACLVRFHGESDNNQEAESEPPYLQRILAITVYVSINFHETRDDMFHQRAIFRFFSTLLHDFSVHERELEARNIDVYGPITQAFLWMEPHLLPGNSFGWVQAITHRSYMPKMLDSNHPNRQKEYLKLLQILLQYLSEKIAESGSPLDEAIKAFYTGVIRLFMVLVYDFPDFVFSNHFSLCEPLSMKCVQLRNIILSSYARNSNLPDPFQPGFKVDRLPEISQAPPIAADFEAIFKSRGIDIKDLENFLTAPGTASSSTETARQFLKRAREPIPEHSKPWQSPKHDVTLINALVLYSIMKIEQHAKNENLLLGNFLKRPKWQSPPLTLLQTFYNELDPEGIPPIQFLLINSLGRFIFLSAVTDQLRFPNSHTYCAVCILLTLFSTTNSNTDDIYAREQITRVLLERLICNRPHPWGLLITFTELLKNESYNFWKLPFTKSTPELEKLFSTLQYTLRPRSVEEYSR